MIISHVCHWFEDFFAPWPSHKSGMPWHGLGTMEQSPCSEQWCVNAEFGIAAVDMFITTGMMLSVFSI